ncbi:hypothetical protein CHELA40_10041 [Chelatococcus asaccharovorans]|nr:hypothetical protein CHELA40_10041 [Chelatococcus asaccharovorans]CAH1687738.1 hypothetical protein CHELA17_65566 [Chelatococcus asaccharovorans]
MRQAAFRIPPNTLNVQGKLAASMPPAWPPFTDPLERRNVPAPGVSLRDEHAIASQ